MKFILTGVIWILYKKRQTDPHGEERKGNKTTVN